jgi:hypothetical protein
MTMQARHAATVVVAMLMALMVMAAGASDAQAAPAVGGCPAHGQVACVDRTDGGRTVHLGVGHVLQVRLGGTALRWSGLHQVGPHILRSGRIEHRNSGVTASYTAVNAGHTTLRAGGAPTCAPGHACPQFILLWQVRVVVG